MSWASCSVRSAGRAGGVLGEDLVTGVQIGGGRRECLRVGLENVALQQADRLGQVGRGLLAPRRGLRVELAGRRIDVADGSYAERRG
jgi:hypothetical protein